MELLQSALSSAIAANDLCPESLSCAALRATIIVNVLVEATASTGTSGSTAKPALPSGELCEELRYQLSGAMEACGRALASQTQLAEPSIAINADQMKTCDPCSLVSAMLTTSTASLSMHRQTRAQYHKLFSRWAMPDESCIGS